MSNRRRLPPCIPDDLTTDQVEWSEPKPRPNEEELQQRLAARRAYREKHGIYNWRDERAKRKQAHSA
jgi:hypothetical protein